MLPLNGQYRQLTNSSRVNYTSGNCSFYFHSASTISGSKVEATKAAPTFITIRN